MVQDLQCLVDDVVIKKEVKRIKVGGRSPEANCITMVEAVLFRAHIY